MGTGLAGRADAFTVETIEGDRLRVLHQSAPDEPAREYAVETRLVAGPRGAEGTSAQYIVAWTSFGGALRLPRFDPYATAEPELWPAQLVPTIEHHGGNRL